MKTSELDKKKDDLATIRKEINPVSYSGEYVITKQVLEELDNDLLAIYIDIFSELVKNHPDFIWAWEETPFTSPGGVRIRWRKISD